MTKSVVSAGATSSNTRLKALDEPPKDRFVNRELAWLSFNERVLEEALDSHVPLLERLKFLAIVSENMDEFFMVRVASLKRMLDAGIETPFPDGLTPREVMRAISTSAAELAARQHAAFHDQIAPRLEKEGVRVLSLDRLDDAQREFLAGYFRRTVMPVVTPLAVDPGHPFPYIGNRSISLVASLAPKGAGADAGTKTAFLPLPTGVLGRFVRLPSAEGRYDFVLLEDAIRAHLDQVFHGFEVVACSAIRVTRDWDLVIDDENAGDLLTSIEESIRARRRGGAVRLHHEATLPAGTRDLLVSKLELDPEDVYSGHGPVGFADFHQICRDVERPDLKDPPFSPLRVGELERGGSIFEALSAADVLVHQPYQSFDYVLRFLRAAAEDPAVLAIKMTLYRTGGGASPIVEALSRAASNGKQVAVLMELKARFDEQANIEGARRLERAGAHVIYGLVGLKTHCKVCLVVRREDRGIRRYAHLSTGNYDARTASSYVDWSLFTAHEEVCEDLTHVFNVITGYCKPGSFRHVVMAPRGMRGRIVDLIRRERAHAEKGLGARIVAKMNALVDPAAIDELYAAARAGVKVDLLVRGMCCLRPGVPGLSENVRVVRIVDRFLEHARALYLANAGEPEVYLASGDWMPRNLDRRIELMFPILDLRHRDRIIRSLETELADDSKANELGPDGRSRARRNGTGSLRAQLAFQEAARELSREDGVAQAGRAS